MIKQAGHRTRRRAAGLTDARAIALDILINRDPQPARRSNTTLAGLGFIYWEPADWLVRHGYARQETGTYVYLTDEGRAFAAEHGIERDR